MLTFRCAPFALLLAVTPLAAQDNYEIQVYGSELVAPKATMVELHSNFTTRGSDGPFGSYHALHETVEITHGFNDFFELGFYQFTSVQAGGGLQYVGNHIRPRFAIPARYHLPVGLSLSQEIGYERTDFSEDTWTWEVRPIIDKTIGRFYGSINPVLGFVLGGPNKGKSPEFAPQAQLGFDVSEKFNLALEYYGTTGTLAQSEPFDHTQQYLFPALNINFGPEWEFNVATGIPLTSVTDRVILKMIIGHRFGARK
jgi:hypothetical protein